MKRAAKQAWTAIRGWILRWKARLGFLEEVHYINGPETLPAPLTQEE